jgi:hypothetical protein
MSLRREIQNPQIFRTYITFSPNHSTLKLSEKSVKSSRSVSLYETDEADRADDKWPEIVIQISDKYRCHVTFNHLDY